MPNVIGFYGLWIWKIVANVYFNIAYYDPQSEEDDVHDFIRGRRIIVITFAALTAKSIFWFYRLGESDFKNFIKVNGPYGIGLKVFWTKVHDNHCIVYYPIAKSEWIRAGL